MNSPHSLSKKFIALAGSLIFGLMANAQPVWTEDFSGFTAGTNYVQGVSVYTFGFDGDGTAAFDVNPSAADNVKAVASGQWAKAAAGTTAFGFNDVGGGNLVTQPNQIGQQAMRGSGTFLSSSLFTSGSGTYQLQYDLIADSQGNNRNARIWIGTSSTHDSTAVNGWGFSLAGVNPSSEPPEEPWRTTGLTAVGTTFSDNLDTSSSFTGTLNFTYTAGEDVSIVFGTTNTDTAFDNLSISLIPEPSSFALLVGLAGTLAVCIRRRR